jgi:hypothetical protein
MTINIDQARRCLALIRDIADRGAWSHDPQIVGYALEELSQVLLERTGCQDRVFEPVSAEVIPNLPALLVELEFVESLITSMEAIRCQ